MEYGKELAVYAAERKDVCMKNDAIPGKPVPGVRSKNEGFGMSRAGESWQD
mgnify:CR=1 FL=1